MLINICRIVKKNWLSKHINYFFIAIKTKIMQICQLFYSENSNLTQKILLKFMVVHCKNKSVKFHPLKVNLDPNFKVLIF